MWRAPRRTGMRLTERSRVANPFPAAWQEANRSRQRVGTVKPRGTSRVCTATGLSAQALKGRVPEV